MAPEALAVHPHPEAARQPVIAAPLLWLAAAVAVLGVAGLAGFRRRDVGRI